MEKNHLEIILEDVNGKFASILEGHQVLHNAIERTREELQEKIEDNSIAIRFLNKKIDTVNGELSNKIESLDKKIDTINGDLSNKIESLDKKIGTINGDLSNKIESLDNKVDKVNDSLGLKIDAVAADLKAHREDTEVYANYRVSEGEN